VYTYRCQIIDKKEREKERKKNKR